MEAQIALSKIKKYSSTESCETVEVIERPLGGISVVFADGQRSGKGAKSISNFTVRKVISLLSDGVRDGAAARATSDTLFAETKGKASASLDILSIDLQTNTIVITRNDPVSLLISINESFTFLKEESKPIGIYRETRPNITEFPIKSCTTVVVYSKGIEKAGSKVNRKIDILGIVQTLLDCEETSPQLIANTILEAAVNLDQGKPEDDFCVIALRIIDHIHEDIRRMFIQLPLNS